jgi:hypothetical protein
VANAHGATPEAIRALKDAAKEINLTVLAKTPQ